MVDKIENTLLIQVPGSNTEGISLMPFGLLGVSSILQKHNIRVRIIDLYTESRQRLLKEIEDFKPHLIGFGGIATSYIYARELSEQLHEYLPESIFIAGGPLACVYELLLEDRIVDYVFHGEVEYSLPKFIKFIETGEGLANIGGISLLKEKLPDLGITQASVKWFKQDERIGRTLPESQLSNLDDCGYPDYGLIDLYKYRRDLRDIYLEYKAGIERLPSLNTKINKLIEQKKIKYFEIFTSRGCAYRCRFCYRNVKGIRSFSVGHVINNIKLLKGRCPIDGIYFADELFNSNLSWVYELCDALQNSDLNLSFYMSGGNRADNINDNFIKRLSQVGFINMNFGHESGSDTVLKYYGKGVTRQQNIDSIMLTRKFNVHTCSQLLIGSPIESMKTIKETNNFLKAADVTMASINYLIPLPQTPIWEEVRAKGYIKDIRKYLERAKKYGSSHWLGYNFSKANKLVWLFWSAYLERTVFLNRNRHNFLKKLYYQTYFYKFVSIIKYILRVLLKRSGQSANATR